MAASAVHADDRVKDGRYVLIKFLYQCSQKAEFPTKRSRYCFANECRIARKRMTSVGDTSLAYP